MSDPRHHPSWNEAVARFRRLRLNREPVDQAKNATLDEYEAAISGVAADPDDWLDQLDQQLQLLADDASLMVRRDATPAAPAPDPRAKVQVAASSKTSPFRFVPLNESVALAPADVLDAGLDHPLPGGFSGTITVAWAAETPLLIGEAQGNPGHVGPARLGPGDDYIIPGATIRGSLRAAMEIVTGGYLSQIDAHLRFGLRDFDHPAFRTEGEEDQSLLANVRPGWLRKAPGFTADNPRYEICPCKDWKTIAIVDLPCRDLAKSDNAWRADWLGKTVTARYREIGLKPELLEDRRHRAIPFDKAKRHAFCLTPEGSIADLKPAPPGSTDAILGTLVFSHKNPTTPTEAALDDEDAALAAARQRINDARAAGKPTNHIEIPAQQKKREYVFLDYTDQEERPPPIQIQPDAWRTFSDIHSKPARRGSEPVGAWAELYRSLEVTGGAGRVPVFYAIDKEGQPQFGLTRFFKIAHEYSVGEMRNRTEVHDRPRFDPADHARVRTERPIDFVEALFGHAFDVLDVFTHDPGNDFAVPPALLARKGRVAVGMATLTEASPDAEPMRPVVTVMSAPRASFAPFYLAGAIKDYSASEAQGTTGLAGRKRYFPRFGQGRLGNAPAAIRASLEGQKAAASGGGPAMDSTLVFLAGKDGRELVFEGQLRLHNVSAEEIGALLWVLTHGGDRTKPYRHMMGHAKTVGAGQMRVDAVTLDLAGHDRDADALLAERPAAWEMRGDDGRTGWLRDPTGQSLVPFLRRFHTWMARVRPGWPGQPPDLRAFLTLARPATGEAIVKASPPEGLARYPRLHGKEFSRLRDRSKLSHKYKLPPGGGEPVRYLGAPTDQNQMVLPYLDP